MSFCETSEGTPVFLRQSGRKVKKMRNIVTQGWPTKNNTPRNHLDELVKNLKKTNIDLNPEKTFYKTNHFGSCEC